MPGVTAPDPAWPSIARPQRGPWLQLLSPQGFEFNRIELPVPGWPASMDGLRVLHLSDTHLTGRWFTAYDRLIEQVHEARPDVVCFTGDLVDDRWNPEPAFAVAERFTRSIRGRLGTLAVIGNHDGDLLAPRVVEWGWTLLHPGVANLGAGDGSAVEFVGLPCVARRDVHPRLLRRLPPARSDVPRVLLSHYPDHLLAAARAVRADVILAGHTHAGQVCLPGGMPIITHDRLPRSMSSGLHRVDGAWLLISRGFGFATYPVRLFAPAEVVLLTLRAASRSAIER